jgi:nitronate monooxygenase
MPSWKVLAVSPSCHWKRSEQNSIQYQQRRALAPVFQFNGHIRSFSCHVCPAPWRTLPFPVIGSPLFIISNPKLVVAQCIAGVVGSMPALNARPAEQLEEWLIEITEALAAYNAAHPDAPAAPFAINQIVHKSNDRLEHDMALCVKYKVPIIITSLGAREDINAAAHSYGGVVLHDVINNKHARKAIEKGADGLIAVAAGAGGHAGVKEPVCADAGNTPVV